MPLLPVSALPPTRSGRPPSRPFGAGRSSTGNGLRGRGPLQTNGLRGRGPLRGRRGLILPMVLLMLLLIALLAGSFAFRVNADRSAFNAVTYQLQTRLAAEAGIEKVLLLLRTQRENVTEWYNNPEELNRIIVWTPEEDKLWGTNQELDEEGVPVYRFSIVADDPLDDLERCRYGLADESGKLNLNTATKQQLTRLIRQVAIEEDMIVEELVDALIDWRDEDKVPGEFGAEAEYYGSLTTPYRPKNGNFDTVEELLLVKGFDGRVLYGEDYDRNGILTPNEDDGAESFPLDNSDGQLNRGLFPYVTVYSQDLNIDRDNQQRIYLYLDANLVSERLNQLFDDPAKVEFIMAALHGAPEQEDEEEEEGKDRQDGEDAEEDGDGDEKNERGETDAGEDARRSEARGGKRDRSRQQAIRGDQDEGEAPGEAGTNGAGDDSSSNGDDGGKKPSVRPETPRLASPADLLLAEVEGMTNPLTVEDLPILMERTTTVDPVLGLPGLVNVLTAPPQVLRCLGDLTGEHIAAIMQTRGELGEEAVRSTAWLVTEGVLDEATFASIAGYITVRSMQFTIESLGYADHVGGISRLQVVVEMRGPVPQVLYYRDLTKLGAVYPIRENEQEYGFGGQRG